MPLVPTMARATLHHSSAKATSSLPLCCPGLCRAKEHVPLCQPSAGHIVTGQELTWAPHSLRGYLAAPRGLWRGHAAPPPRQQLREQGSPSQTTCCTHSVLLSLPGAAWSLSGRGLCMARSLDWIQVVFLSGVGKNQILGIPVDVFITSMWGC